MYLPCISKKKIKVGKIIQPSSVSSLSFHTLSLDTCMALLFLLKQLLFVVNIKE